MKKLICILIVFLLISNCAQPEPTYDKGMKVFMLSTWILLGGGLGIFCSNIPSQSLQFNQKVNPPSSGGPFSYKVSGINRGNKIILSNLATTQTTCTVGISFTLCNFINLMDQSNLRKNICSEYPNTSTVRASFGSQTTCTINIDTVPFQNSVIITLGSDSERCSGQMEVN
jgi:hypothetical protein